uniref:Putative transporter major facilitator superfamily n=2 Tax=Triatoma infestans TaxID=30076 RepID=A0A023F6I8_TRIIF
MLNTGLARQWLASFSAALCMAIAGTVFTWLTPIAVQLTSEGSPIRMTEVQRSWVTGCASIGNTVSCIPIGIIAHRWGRKPILLVAGPVALLGWILMITTRSLQVLYFVGIIHGFTMATAFCISSVYIAEIASPKIRGALCGQFMTFYYLGLVYVDIIAYLTDYTVYLYLLTILPIFYTVLFYFMPETPYYLMKSGKDSKVVESLNWLRPQKNSFVGEKFIEMKTSINHDFSWKDLFLVKSQRRAMIIVIIAYCLKCFGGQISLQVYTTQILSTLTSNSDYSMILTAVSNIILCLTCFISGFISDTLGRRPVMYTTSFASGIFHLIVMIYFFVYNSNLKTFSTINLWIIFASMTLALILGNASMSIFLPTVSAEYFNTEGRTLGSGIVHAVAGLAAFTSIIAYQAIKDSIGDYFNFLIFAVCSIVASIVIFYFVPETARKSLERIQKEIE